jgi:hypothetical protein
MMPGRGRLPPGRSRELSGKGEGKFMDLADFHYYEPSKGHGLRHNPFNAIVAPRPIGWISSRNAVGQLNLAPYSFFNAFLYDPPITDSPQFPGRTPSRMSARPANSSGIW